MADRYWVGGTGTWGTTTTNWAATSGGASGASVPTAADNVFFDANSNVGTDAFTVTLQTNPRVCNDITVSGLDGAMTLAGSSVGLTISGSLLFSGGLLTRTYTGTTTFNATTTGKTITTNGVSLSATTFNGVGGGWTLGSFFSCGTGALTVTNGTFDTSASNYGVSCGSLVSTTGTRTINFRDSTITPATTGANTTLNSTGLTFIAGNSTISFGSNHDLRVTGGITFYNVQFLTTSSAFTITGTNTFNNLTITRTGSGGSAAVFFTGDQTINGIFAVNTPSAIVRITIASGSGSDNYARGTTRTLTCASIATMSDVDFSDITIAGAHGTLSGTRLGDCGGNSNITFDAGKTVYWNKAAGGSWQDTAWALSSGGAVSVNNFPLAQDTAIFQNTGLNASETIFLGDVYNIGTVDFSARTNSVTCQFTNIGSNFFGDFIYGSGVTTSGFTTTVFTFANRSIKTINSAGKTFPQSITIDAPSGGIQLVTNNLTLNSTQTTTLTSGTLDLNNLTLSTGLFSSSISNTRTIAFGTGKISCTGTGTVWTTANAANLTTTGTQVVDVTSVGSTAITVTPGIPSQAYSISFNFTGGTYALTFLATANHLVRNVNFTGYAGTWNAIGSNVIIYGNLTLSTGMTLTASGNVLSFGATSGTKTITSNGRTMDFPITFDGVGGTFQLQDPLTMGSTRTATLSNGTLDLQSYTLSTGLFSSDNSNTRTIAFGTGNITCTGTGLVWATATVTGLTTTGTQVVNVTSTGSTAISLQPGVISEANSISFNFTGGTYTLTILNIPNYGVRNLDFTGFAGTWGVTNNGIIYGNLTLSVGMSLTAANPAIQFSATSGTKTITSNGRTMDFPITFNGVGGTWACQDALTLGSTRALTMTNGTLQLKDGVTSTVGSFVTTGTTLKYLQSTTSGVQATLSDLSGVNTVTYLSIQDSNATGGATFYAYDPTNVDAGNNTGWFFVFTGGGSFLMFF